MKTVYHPTFPDISRQVPGSSLKEWLRAGWLKSPIMPAGKSVETAAPSEVDPERNSA